MLINKLMDKRDAVLVVDSYCVFDTTRLNTGGKMAAAWNFM